MSRQLEDSEHAQENREVAAVIAGCATGRGVLIAVTLGAVAAGAAYLVLSRRSR